MLTRMIKVQLVVFAVITVVASVLLLARFDVFGRVFHPPVIVRVHLAQSGGLYPRAGVDLLGTPVGIVRDLNVDPGGDVVATLEINRDARIPVDVRAVVTNRSAIGEQYLALTPQRTDGPLLTDGSEIPVSRTGTPVQTDRLLSHLNALVADLPPEALSTDIAETARGFGNTSDQLRQLLEQSNDLTHTALASLDDQLRLIDGAATVLDTQNAAAPDITSLSRRLASLTDRLRTLVPTFAAAFTDGTRAATQLTALAKNNADALPRLLVDLGDVSDTLGKHRPGIRKTLAATPWVLQYALGAIRYCDANDPVTGRPIESTCVYDAQGKRTYAGRLAIVVPPPNDPPGTVEPCSRGYEATRHYLPDGDPASGQGPPEPRTPPQDGHVGCTAPPTDPMTPNVRGAQNLPR